MNIRKDKVPNSVHYSQSPWQYDKGPFYTQAEQTKIKLMSMAEINREQILCRLYLLFPRVARHEIYRLFRMYSGDTLRTIDTLLYSEMRHMTKMNGLRGRKSRVAWPEKPHGQCARTYAMYRPKKFNWRTITSGTVYNVQPDASPVPQVQQVLDTYSAQLYARRFPNFVANATFDNMGITNIVFETLQPRGGGDDEYVIENRPPHKHERKTSILDSPGQMQTVLHSQLSDSNETNTPRHSLKMKLIRNGDSYSAKIIPS